MKNSKRKQTTSATDTKIDVQPNAPQPKKTLKVSGTRVKIESEELKSLPTVRYDSDYGHVIVSGVGRATNWIAKRTWINQIKHREKYKVVGDALMVTVGAKTVAELLHAHRVVTTGDLRRNIAAIEASLNSPASRRWATAAETAAYVNAEIKLRKRYLEKALERVRVGIVSDIKNVNTAMRAVKSDANALDKSLTKLEALRKTYPTYFDKHADSAITDGTNALLAASKLLT